MCGCGTRGRSSPRCTASTRTAPAHGAAREPAHISSLGTLLCSGLFLTWRKLTAYNGRFYYYLPKAWVAANSFHISYWVLLL